MSKTDLKVHRFTVPPLSLLVVDMSSADLAGTEQHPLALVVLVIKNKSSVHSLYSCPPTPEGNT